MTHDMLRLAHIIGLALIAAGLIGVFVSDLRARQLRDVRLFAEAVRNIALFYDGVVVPGALLLAASGTWMIVAFYDGWSFLSVPWLSGMVALFLFEFVEGNTVTRIYFTRLLRLARAAAAEGRVTPDLARARQETVPTFTHFLDIPLLLVIVTLGVLRPDGWALFLAGTALALTVASALTVLLRRLYPWAPDS